jgi:hypothetical protein
LKKVKKQKPKIKKRMIGLDKLKVKCYSGHAYAERPKSFQWQGIDYEVVEIEKAWQEPGEKHFKIRTKDSKLFNICYNELEKDWSLTELVGG